MGSGGPAAPLIPTGVGVLETGLQLKARKYYTDSEEAGLHRKKFPPLVPDWSIFKQMRTWYSHSLIGSNSTALIGQQRCQCECIVAQLPLSITGL